MTDYRVGLYLTPMTLPNAQTEVVEKSPFQISTERFESVESSKHVV